MTSDIYVRYYPMPISIKSYVVASPDGSYTIIINSNLSHDMALIAYNHEMQHIKDGDCEKKSDADIIEIFAHEK